MNVLPYKTTAFKYKLILKKILGIIHVVLYKYLNWLANKTTGTGQTTNNSNNTSYSMIIVAITMLKQITKVIMIMITIAIIISNL